MSYLSLAYDGMLYSELVAINPYNSQISFLSYIASRSKAPIDDITTLVKAVYKERSDLSIIHLPALEMLKLRVKSWHPLPENTRTLLELIQEVSDTLIKLGKNNPNSKLFG